MTGDITDDLAFDGQAFQMGQCVLNVGFFAGDGHDEAAEGNAVDVVDVSVQNGNVEVVVANEVRDDGFVGDVAAEGEADGRRVVRMVPLFRDIHVAQRFGDFVGDDGTDETARRFRLRRGEEVDDGAFFDDFSFFDDGDAVGDLLDDFHLVGNQNDGDAEFFIDVFQKLENGFHGFRVEGRGRFVGEKDGRIGNDGARDANTLFLAAGELRRIFVFIFGEADEVQNGFDFFRLFRFGHAGKFQWEGDVLVNGAPGEKIEMLEDHADVFPGFAKIFFGKFRHVFAADDDFAGGGGFEHIDAADERGFAGTGLSDNAENFAVIDREVDVVQGYDMAVVAFGDVL